MLTENLLNTNHHTIMNLKQNPTKEQLKSLIASKNDKAGHHMIWVSFDGDVSIDMIPDDLSPNGFAKLLENRMQFRFETLHVDNDYVGPQAAKDQDWVDRVYTALIKNYESGVRGYIDEF